MIEHMDKIVAVVLFLTVILSGVIDQSNPFAYVFIRLTMCLCAGYAANALWNN